MPVRRHFGSIRKLPSGRYQASYWHNVTRHVAPETFTSKADAQRWLSNIETVIHNGEWVDPAGGRMTVAELADRWKRSDPSKRSSTRARDDAILMWNGLSSGPRRYAGRALWARRTGGPGRMFAG